VRAFDTIGEFPQRRKKKGKKKEGRGVGRHILCADMAPPERKKKNGTCSFRYFPGIHKVKQRKRERKERRCVSSPSSWDSGKEGGESKGIALISQFSEEGKRGERGDRHRTTGGILRREGDGGNESRCIVYRLRPNIPSRGKKGGKRPIPISLPQKEGDRNRFNPPPPQKGGGKKRKTLRVAQKRGNPRSSLGSSTITEKEKKKGKKEGGYGY